MEAMKRGSANEEAVMSALRALPRVKEMFEVGMFAMKMARYLACSPDGLALLHRDALGDLAPEPNAADDDFTNHLVVASVEIKTRVAPSSLAQVLPLARADIVQCEVGDENFTKYVPKEHMAQVLQQLLVLGIRYAVYVAAAETVIPYTVVTKCSDAALEKCFEVLKAVADPVVRWAQEQVGAVPAFIPAEYIATLSSRHKFWRLVDQHVKEKSTFFP